MSNFYSFINQQNLALSKSADNANCDGVIDDTVSKYKQMNKLCRIWQQFCSLKRNAVCFPLLKGRENA